MAEGLGEKATVEALIEEVVADGAAVEAAGAEKHANMEAADAVALHDAAVDATAVAEEKREEAAAATAFAGAAAEEAGAVNIAGFLETKVSKELNAEVAAQAADVAGLRAAVEAAKAEAQKAEAAEIAARGTETHKQKVRELATILLASIEAETNLRDAEEAAAADMATAVAGAAGALSEKKQMEAQGATAAAEMVKAAAEDQTDD